MTLKSTSSHYGTVAILIHWSTAIAILIMFISGLSSGNQTDPMDKEALLRVHVPLGIAILALTLLRVVWWWLADKHPAPPTEQPRWQQIAANIVHGLIYVFLILMATSGIATVATSGALPAIFGGGPLPDFETLVPRIAHGVMARVVLGLLVVHIGAALYHQFIRHDRLLARMGIGRA